MASSSRENRAPERPGCDLPPDLAKPAQRALAGAGIQNLAQLAEFSEAEISKLHGMGPKALGRLRQAMSAKGLTYASDTPMPEST